MSHSIESKLASLGIVLPPISLPQANYVPFVISGNLLYLSGQGPKTSEGTWLCGKVGDDVSVETAYQHARQTGIGLVNATPQFTEHPKVINGCSDLLVEVFGDAGRHARSAIGVGSLPMGITVEIEAILLFR